MIVSSIKGTITPDTMADLFVKYGYRSANSGTYWSAFRAVADEFDITYQETSNMDTMLELLKTNHYVVASVGNGLFTYGGHFIVLVDVEDNILKIYDPYLYNGKFDTSSRRNADVTVSGNTVYVSVDNFKKYANTKGFFIYEYNEITVNKENTTDTKVVTNTNIQDTTGTIYKLKSNTKLYTSSSMKTGYNYKKGTAVTVLENITSKISKVKVNKTGLVRYMYNSDTSSTQNMVSTTQNTTTDNKVYTLTQKTKLYSNSRLTSGYNYKKGTKVTLISKISSTIAKVKVVKTSLVRYVNIKYLK